MDQQPQRLQACAIRINDTPRIAGRNPMKWITREHVKVDRVACPWLIRKFVDLDAEFIFVPAAKVMDEAKNSVGKSCSDTVAAHSFSVLALLDRIEAELLGLDC